MGGGCSPAVLARLEQPREREREVRVHLRGPRGGAEEAGGVPRPGVHWARHPPSRFEAVHDGLHVLARDELKQQPREVHPDVHNQLARRGKACRALHQCYISVTIVSQQGLHRRHRPPQQQHLLLANSSVTLVLHQCYTSVTSVLHQGLLRSFRSHSLCGFVRLWVRGFGWCCCGCVVVGVWCWMCGAGCGAHTGWAVADSAREGPAPRAVRGDELLQGLQPAMPEGLDGLYEQVAVFDGCNDPADGYEPFGSRLAILLHTTLEDAASES
eukprot:3757792-Pyramimonas_sp.AAC.1